MHKGVVNFLRVLHLEHNDVVRPKEGQIKEAVARPREIKAAQIALNICI